MCIKRAGLVWALVLLTTTCFILTCAAPSGSTTPEPPTVSTTPPVTPTDGVDSSKKTNEEAPVTPTVSSDPNGDDEYLYYKIKKRISLERNLTLSDIRYVLSQNDEEDQFMYALADKLGYMSDGHNDPHIPVIRSHRKKLIELLEKMAAKKEPKPPISQEDEGPSVSSDEMPASKEPPSPSDIKKIAFEVSVDIHDRLGPDAIQDILSDLTFSDALGYAVGDKLGYSQGDKLKYLEDANTDELKRILQQTLKSKTSTKTTPDDSIDNSRVPSGGSQEAGKVNGNGDQTQEGERNRVSEGAGEPSNSLLPQNNDDTQDTQKQTLPPVELPTEEEEEDLQVTKPSAKPEPEEDGMDGTKEAGDVSSNTDDPEDGNNHQANKVPGEKTIENASLNKEDLRGEDGDPNDVGPSPNNSPDDEHERMEQFNADDDGGGDFEFLSKIGEAERTRLLNSDGFRTFLENEYNELYKQFVAKEADPNEVYLALEEYLELQSVSGRSGVANDGEGGENKSSKIEPGDGNVPEKAKESKTVRKRAVHVHTLYVYPIFDLVHTSGEEGTPCVCVRACVFNRLAAKVFIGILFTDCGMNLDDHRV